MTDLTAPKAIKQVEAISVMLATEELAPPERTALKQERQALTLALLRGELKPGTADPPSWRLRFIDAITLIAAFIYAIPVVPMLALFFWASGLFRVYRGNMKW